MHIAAKTNGESSGSPSSSSSSFTTIKITDAIVDVARLHAAVVRTSGRIELTDAEGNACVLMTKSELDALEHALEILSNTDDVRAMNDQLARIAMLTTPSAE